VAGELLAVDDRVQVRSGVVLAGGAAAVLVNGACILGVLGLAKHKLARANEGVAKPLHTMLVRLKASKTHVAAVYLEAISGWKGMAYRCSRREDAVKHVHS